MSTTAEVQGVATGVLTALDRCDRCGAQAIVRREHTDLALELQFCAHHDTKHGAPLAEQGFTVTARNEIPA